VHNIIFHSACRNRRISQKRASEQKHTDSFQGKVPVPAVKSCKNAAVAAGRAFQPKKPVFPSKKRFPRALFQQAIKTGRRFSSPNLTAIVPSKEIISSGGCGYSVVVPKKVARLSIKRHQIRRRVLAALRMSEAILPPALIIFPRSSISSVSYHDTEDELTNLISKISH